MGVVLAEPDYCFIGADSILISSLCKKRGRGKKMFAFYVLVSLLNSVSLCLSITSAQVHFSQVFAIIFVLSDCYYCTHCGKLQTLVISIIRLAIKPLSHKIRHKSAEESGKEDPYHHEYSLLHTFANNVKQ